MSSPPQPHLSKLQLHPQPIRILLSNTNQFVHRITSQPNELRLNNTLANGQIFSFRHISDLPIAIFGAPLYENDSDTSQTTPIQNQQFLFNNAWCGALGKIPVLLLENEVSVYALSLSNGSNNRHSPQFFDDDTEMLDELYYLLRLTRSSLKITQNQHVDMPALVAKWERSDQFFNQTLTQSPQHTLGVRVLDQSRRISETIWAFICSQNNNTIRIAQNVQKICTLYGDYLTSISLVNENNVYTISHGKQNEHDRSASPPDNCIHLYAFPSLSSLPTIEDCEDEGSLETILRNNAYGYRAAYFHQFLPHLDHLNQNGITIENVCYKLLGNNYEEQLNYLLKISNFKGGGVKGQSVAQQILCSFTGVGMKVASCIALFALNQENNIPMDVHVHRLMIKQYSRRAYIWAVEKLVYHLLSTYHSHTMDELNQYVKDVMNGEIFLHSANHNTLKKKLVKKRKVMESDPCEDLDTTNGDSSTISHVTTFEQIVERFEQQHQENGLSPKTKPAFLHCPAPENLLENNQTSSERLPLLPPQIESESPQLPIILTLKSLLDPQATNKIETPNMPYIINNFPPTPDYIQSAATLMTMYLKIYPQLKKHQDRVIAHIIQLLQSHEPNNVSKLSNSFYIGTIIDIISDIVCTNLLYDQDLTFHESAVPKPTPALSHAFEVFFNDLLSPAAGWAHSVLFTALIKENKK